MDARIRVGVLLFARDKLLLVKHVDPVSGFEWWVPPGGGIEEDETVYDAARREVHEETGLTIEPGEPVYLRQFIHETGSMNNMDMYVTGRIVGGSETTSNIYGKGADEHLIKDLDYFSSDEMQDIVVFPRVIQSRMWKDKEEGFSQLVFLGVEREGD